MTKQRLNVKVFEVVVPCSDSHEVLSCDAINYKGGTWIVPEWINHPAAGWRTPMRMIRVDKLGLLEAKDSPYGHLSVPAMKLSKAVLEGRAQPQAPVELIVLPELELQIPRGSLPQ